ncbi:hypothetical protein AsAng_0062550 [Aureispira anguillae]|uniref:Uncharacterized protein n=1 Tax=Aureispira anguillae TaxID=2864201 RepID=A0A916DWH3_9BACT|nr:hypothetical protein AsAng_0062550 [Aureispira anguillae]
MVQFNQRSVFSSFFAEDSLAYKPQIHKKANRKSIGLPSS